MRVLEVISGVVGAVAAAVAVVFSYRTVRSAQAAARADRADRDLQRVERVSDAVAAVLDAAYRASHNQPITRFFDAVTRLEVALLSCPVSLPICERVVSERDYIGAMGAREALRTELRDAIQRLSPRDPDV